VLPDEYLNPRALPRHLQKQPEKEKPFTFVIRPATLADMAEVREIYNYYVMNSVVTFDEHRKSLREWQAKFKYLEKHDMPFLVASSPNGQLLGYALVSPWRQKRAFRFTVESSIYLGAAATGKKLGPALLKALIDASQQAGLKEMIAVIADQGADASLKLHERFGFTEVGRMGRVGFKFGRWLGTVTLQKSIVRS